MNWNEERDPNYAYIALPPPHLSSFLVWISGESFFVLFFLHLISFCTSSLASFLFINSISSFIPRFALLSLSRNQFLVVQCSSSSTIFLPSGSERLDTSFTFNLLSLFFSSFNPLQKHLLGTNRCLHLFSHLPSSISFPLSQPIHLYFLFHSIPGR